MKKRFSIRRCAILLLVCYVFAMVMLRLFEHSLIYYPSRVLDAKPSLLGRPFEDVFIPLENGQKINAWYFPFHPGRILKSDRVLLVSHGNAGNISHRLDLAAVLLEAGGSVLLYDYEGYGSSTGKPGEAATYQDADAAWQWLTEKGFTNTNIVAYGESLGGGIATELAMRKPIGGLILQSSFTSMTDMGAELFPWLPVRWISTVNYNTLQKLPRLKIPVLILHSRQDKLIPFRHAEKNFAAANSPKYFCEIDGDHNDGLCASRAKILKAVQDFSASLSGRE